MRSGVARAVRRALVAGLVGVALASCGGSSGSDGAADDALDGDMAAPDPAETQPAESTTTLAPAPTVAPQTWAIRDGVLTQEPGVDATVWSPEKTVKVGDTYRSYFVSKKDRYLVYAESTDGVTFTSWTRTNLRRKDDVGSETRYMDHPVVIVREDGKYLLVYDICTGDCDVPPSLPRRLVARVSDDGVTWGPGVMIPEPAAPGLNPEGKVFDSVATLVRLDGGAIRAYYVQGGGAIGSATTVDGGATWTIDEGLRLGRNDGGSAPKAWHIDPVAIRDDDGMTYLYFGYVTDWNCLGSGGTPAGCVPIRMAYSTDGLAFEMSPDVVLTPEPGATQYGDPDVFVGPDGKWMMLIGDVRMVDGKMSVSLRVADRTS